MRSLGQQLADAFERSGWSVAELLGKTGLDLERSALHRKLKGDRPTTLDEAQAIADALGCELTWKPRAHVGRRRAIAA